MKQQPFLDEAFDKGLQLAFPPVMVQLLKALLDPEPSFDTIARYLEMDALLAGKVLHIVNSSNYGFAEKFTSLHRAAVAMGTADLFKLVISLSLQKKLHPAPGRAPRSLYADWRLTLWSALAAEAVAGCLCPRYKGEAYLGGMLKDLPIYLALGAADAPGFLRQGGPATLYSAGAAVDELGHWGRGHAEIARDILLFWGLPEELCEAVRMHHDPAAANGTLLDKSLFFGTRWAELLHAPEPDPGELVSFELLLAAELDLNKAELETFRKACADKFNALAGQLGIKNGGQEPVLHEQPLASIQSCYFLALGALRDIVPHGGGGMASTLQQQLKLFWGVTRWRLRLALPGAGDELCFLCENAGLRQVAPEKQDVAPPPGWSSLFLAVGDFKYGRLDVGMAEESMRQGSLPTFVHMLAFCLDENRRRAPADRQGMSLHALPFVMARLDEGGAITDATGRFLDVFGLSALPRGTRASVLLEERLGISRASFCSLSGAGGRILTAPEGRVSGTPVYLARTQALDAQGGSYLLLGEAVGMSENQSLTLGHPGFMEALLGGIEERVFLLDASGKVLWGDASARSFVGKVLFGFVRPEEMDAEAWNADFLAQVLEPVTLRAVVAPDDAPHDIVIAPLAGSGAKRYLVAVRQVNGQANGQTERQADHGQEAPRRDPLTGLYGYSQFHTLLKHFSDIAGKSRFAVGIVFCDIRALDAVNREHGHFKGDALLRSAAGILSDACRKGLDFPCRYCSDKFALLVSRATPQLMDSMAARVLQLVAEQGDPLLRLAIGMALVEPGQDPKTRLDAARSECRTANAMNEEVRWA